MRTLILAAAAVLVAGSAMAQLPGGISFGPAAPVGEGYASTGDADLDRAMKICAGVKVFENYQTCDWYCTTPYHYPKNYNTACRDAEAAWNKSDTARKMRETAEKRDADLVWLRQWAATKGK